MLLNWQTQLVWHAGLQLTLARCQFQVVYKFHLKSFDWSFPPLACVHCPGDSWIQFWWKNICCNKGREDTQLVWSFSIFTQIIFLFPRRGSNPRPRESSALTTRPWFLKIMCCKQFCSEKIIISQLVYLLNFACLTCLWDFRQYSLDKCYITIKEDTLIDIFYLVVNKPDLFKTLFFIKDLLNY